MEADISCQKALRFFYSASFMLREFFAPYVFSIMMARVVFIISSAFCISDASKAGARIYGELCCGRLTESYTTTGSTIWQAHLRWHFGFIYSRDAFYFLGFSTVKVGCFCRTYVVIPVMACFLYVTSPSLT
jgi:hypothetical protein